MAAEADAKQHRGVLKRKEKREKLLKQDSPELEVQEEHVGKMLLSLTHRAVAVLVCKFLPAGTAVQLRVVVVSSHGCVGAQQALVLLPAAPHGSHDVLVGCRA